MRHGFIYVIQNLVTGRAYIGQTTNYKRRRNEHLRALVNGTHFNRRLQHNWNKYGERQFEITCIREAPVDVLTTYEQYFLDMYRTFAAGVFNSEGPVDAPSMGAERSAEFRENIRRLHTGKRYSDATKAKIGAASRGRRFNLSLEARAKISEANRRRKLSPETRKKIGAGNRGKKHIFSDTHRENLSRALKDYRRRVRDKAVT